MILLLEKRETDIMIIGKVVIEIVSRFREEVIILLLEKRGADIVIIEEVVKVVAGNKGSRKEVMILLLEK